MNLRAVAPKASLPVVGNVPAAGFHMFMKFKGIPKIPKGKLPAKPTRSRRSRNSQNSHDEIASLGLFRQGDKHG